MVQFKMKLVLLLVLSLDSARAFCLSSRGASTITTTATTTTTTATRLGQVASTSAPEFTTIVNPTDDDDTEEDDKQQEKIRPFHQNWWPVTTLDAIDPTRPNAVKLLGMDLVLYQSSDNEWSCLEDRCAHRFAPLSEGRVIDSTSGKDNSADDGSSSSSISSSNTTMKHLQCAYHGWEFNNDGECQKVPQMKEQQIQNNNGKAIKGCGIKTYPTRVDAGMIFVWADPETANLGQLIPLPTFPLLREKVDDGNICFMRDLPYGYELLGENLLDLSHLPFSHHSVGNLDRNLGGPLPFKMLSASQKSSDNPLYEAILEDAANTDPQFKKNPLTPADASLNLGFYEPSLVRYTRNSTMETRIVAFFCPTSASKSRVFLFNLFGGSNKKDTSGSSGTNEKKSKIQRMKDWTKPSTIKAKIQKKIFGLIFTPVYFHQMSHKIFDGDGIFLRMQGDRMQREGLTFRDYKTPTSADLLVNAFRRYVNTADKLTRKAGKASMADVASSTMAYGDNLSREEMLDRYHSHTKNCKICSTALKKKETNKSRFKIAQSITNGGIGASSATLLMMLGLATSEVAVPTAVLRVVASVFLGSISASVGLSKLNTMNDKAIQQFMFEDYIHADKN
jgi:pheophorbide a oxygenase